jgi:hypothetical protein
MKTPHVILAALLVMSAVARADPGNVWHIPGNTEAGVPATMRDPVNPQPGASTTFYQGVWKGWLGDEFTPMDPNRANQTGGTFHYRIDGAGWQTQTLAFHSNVQEDTRFHNQFWKASVTAPGTAGFLVEYYFEVTFSNRDTTYLFGNNQTGVVKADAEASPTAFTVAFPVPSLTVNGVNANYSKSNFHIDEVNDMQFPQIEVLFTPNVPNLEAVEVFTNLNNRDRAAQDYDNDGIEDGIIPPDGNGITTADTGAYYQAHAMQDLGGGNFRLILPVEKTGAYRLTGRYKVIGNPNWIWVGDSGIRDHAIIVAPKAARDMNIYELHVSNANATGPTFAQRGTFEDLHDPAARVNLDWLDNLGLNWIWFQPFHPQGIDGRENDPATSQAYDPGSPYSIRNFWQINTLYTSEYNGGLPDPVSHPDNYASAMSAFQDFVAASDEKGIGLMLDFPFNHTSPDVVLGQKGVEIFAPAGNPGNWQPGDEIRHRVPQFFSTNGSEGPAAYSAPAQGAAGVAVAPDRDDFGKWNDVRDVFFGRYATLVTGYPGADSSRATVRNEGDWMDYSSLGAPTVNVWRYFGEVLPYWLGQSGHRGFNSTPADGDGPTRVALDSAGIDGLRKDFGQGLPPQCMEYIINRTHSVKWNFVFMSESLDGGEVTYRSSRHFAVLNENIVFPLLDATETSKYRDVFENRRSAYGGSLVLLNNTSHDEVPYADSWQALIRYATVSTNDGAPMVMYGQEIGAGQRFQESLPQGAFDWYELNFGKYIPHFKKWNSMQPQWTAWDDNEVGVQFLFPVYSGIGKARQFSPALRSNNRWFLNRQSDGQPNQRIFAVAKYEAPDVSTAFQDVVLAFTNLDRNSTVADVFGISANLADLLGLASGRTYNVRNLAAYLGRENEHAGRRDSWLWGGGLSRGQIVNDGVFVSLNPVPVTDAAWATHPYEPQFLKVYDVTPPPSPDPLAAYYALGETATFTWNPQPGPHDNITSFLVEVFDENDNLLVSGTVTDGSNQYTFTGTLGTTYYARVTSVSLAGVSSTSPGSSDDGPPDPGSATTRVILLDPDGDADGDGHSNASEDLAGTNPLDAASALRVTASVIQGADVVLTVATVPGKSYQLLTSTTLAPPWSPVGGVIVATGAETQFPHTGGAVDARRFYQVAVVP